MSRQIEYDKWPFLTTSDNPFDPDKEWEKWLDFDETHSYHTLSYISRITNLSDKLSDSANFDIAELAVNEAVKCNPLALVTGGRVGYLKTYLH